MIRNRVEESQLQQLDIAKYYKPASLVQLDMKQFLYQELIIKEKEFRVALTKTNWEDYKDKMVGIYCSVDVILPQWVFMLLTKHLAGVAEQVFVGDYDFLVRMGYLNQLQKVDFSTFQDAKVVIKGCSDVPQGEFVLAQLVDQLLPFVSSIMYGEPCSTVPIYKRKK